MLTKKPLIMLSGGSMGELPNQYFLKDAGFNIVDRTSNTMLSLSNNNDIINITSGTFTQTFDSAAALGGGWNCIICNKGTGIITVDPSGAELIDGLSTYKIYPGEVRQVFCSGTAFSSVIWRPFSVLFTTTTSFYMPPGYSACYFEMAGGGGGGAGGRTNASVASSGAGGGGGGAYREGEIPASLFMPAGSTISLQIGAGGSAGTAGVTSSSAGSGGRTYFSTAYGQEISAYGGGGGRRETVSTAGTGGGGGGWLSGGSGSTAGTGNLANYDKGTTQAVTENTIFGGLAGGVGGGNVSVNAVPIPGKTAFGGGGGGGSGGVTSSVVGTSGDGYAPNGMLGGPAGSGGNPGNVVNTSRLAGGGGGSSVLSGTAAVGGAGYLGGGGGAGGTSYNGTGGAGGVGGSGFILLRGI